MEWVLAKALGFDKLTQGQGMKTNVKKAEDQSHPGTCQHLEKEDQWSLSSQANLLFLCCLMERQQWPSLLPRFFSPYGYT